ncbi:MAG: 2-oxoglutarate dehydrogenase E1 component [Myxococcota bacterium]
MTQYNQFSGDDALYIDGLYSKWCDSPDSVDASWQQIFQSWHISPEEAQPQPPDLRSIFSSLPGVNTSATTGIEEATHRQARVAQLINAYRVRGHTEANIDPLGRRIIEPHPELQLSFYQLRESDLDKPVSGHGVFGVPNVTTLRHIVKRLRAAYCQGFGVEFMNINDPVKKRWLQSRIETLQDDDILKDDEEMHMLRLLADSENFETFLHNRYPGTKRFSLEGAETLIPLLASLIETASVSGARQMMLGMAHRGRLNVLANILNKPIRYILDEFDDEASDEFEISGDVKYHLGYSSDYNCRNGEKVRITLGFNPSHLEAVNPVIEGRCRARQDRFTSADAGEKALVPLLIHGDAAFAGQGVVAEVFQLSQLEAYRTGGTIHVVVNNQIGFTTTPKDARSTPYCSDIARMLAVPIFHVNGEDVEAVAAVAKIAAEWRQTFHQDVVIDMVSFRKWGHNEGDEPSFTQPLLYDTIRKHPSPKMAYAKKMMARGKTMEDINAVVSDSRIRLEQHLTAELAYDDYTTKGESTSKGLWGPYGHDGIIDDIDTTFDAEELKSILTNVNTNPEVITVHRKIKRILDQRLKMVNGTTPVDWAVGEQAAYATIVNEGFRVRISGQDCGRGTFSHRHAVLTDINTGEEYVPLSHVSEGQGEFQVFNSFLSEYAVLGFEHGYSLDAPDALVIWEAQFGDFANGAQIIIDNFIMATEQKWNRLSGLVLLLPHGYEGQGPEHSSARLERFLQLCAEDNVQVANCTTPANFFHLLRRQVHMTTRKPLVVMSPKSMLRHPKCHSTMEDLSNGSFQPVIADKCDNTAEVQKLVFVSGKIYYDLKAKQETTQSTHVRLVRIERLYPFPAREVAKITANHPNAELVWCQEEPRNMGPWPMFNEWFYEATQSNPTYIGRKAAASPATGSPKKHRAEQAQIMGAVFGHLD